EILGAQAHETTSLLHHFLGRDGDGEHLAQFAPQVVQIPVVGAAQRRAAHDADDDLVDPFLDPGFNVFAPQALTPFAAPPLAPRAMLTTTWSTHSSIVGSTSSPSRISRRSW